MKRNHSLGLFILALILLGGLPSRVKALPVTEAQVRQCATKAVLELNGVPRSEIQVLPGEPQPDGVSLVRWQTRQGRAGYCLVDAAGTVLEFNEEAASAVRRRSAIDPVFLRPGRAVVVTTDGGSLNVRHSPDGEVTGSAANGSVLVVTGQTSGEWVEIEGGQWVSGYHLSPASLPAAGPAERSPRQAVVSTAGNDLNVRDRPNGAIVSTVPNGSTVQLTGRTVEGWVELETGGWVSQDYLQ